MTIIVCNGLEIYKDLFVVLDILEYMGLAGFKSSDWLVEGSFCCYVLYIIVLNPF